MWRRNVVICAVAFAAFAILRRPMTVSAAETPGILVTPAMTQIVEGASRDDYTEVGFTVRNAAPHEWHLRVIGKSCACFSPKLSSEVLPPDSVLTVVIPVYVPISGRRDGIVVLRSEGGGHTVDLPLAFEVRAHFPDGLEVAPKRVRVPSVNGTVSVILSLNTPVRDRPVTTRVVDNTGRQLDHVVVSDWREVEGRMGAILRVPFVYPASFDAHAGFKVIVLGERGSREVFIPVELGS